MSALGVFDGISPDYSSAVMVELFQSGEWVEFLRSAVLLIWEDRLLSHKLYFLCFGAFHAGNWIPKILKEHVTPHVQWTREAINQTFTSNWTWNDALSNLVKASKFSQCGYFTFYFLIILIWIACGSITYVCLREVCVQWDFTSW